MSLLFRPYRPIVRLVAGVAPRDVSPPPAAGKEQPRQANASPAIDEHRDPERVGRSWSQWPPPRDGRRRMHRRDHIVGILERLARLHDAGQLDDAEYAAAKSRLLRF